MPMHEVEDDGVQSEGRRLDAFDVLEPHTQSIAHPFNFVLFVHCCVVEEQEDAGYVDCGRCCRC